MKISKTESTERPPEWDLDSSPDVVYHNTDVEEIPATEDRPPMYGYTQEEYTRLEYAQQQAEANAARCDYLEMAIIALMDKEVQ
ncbi:MAG: hypothetical protein RR998_08300 [Oscillospiraceae bacterium]